jgi:hypothetical protein
MIAFFKGFVSKCAKSNGGQGMVTFSKSANHLSQISKLLGVQPGNRKSTFFVVHPKGKSANFYGVPVRLLQIRKFFTIGQRGRNTSFQKSGLLSAILLQTS